MLPVRAILFDADGVIQHSSSDDLPARLERIMGFVPASLDSFVGEVFDAERLAMTGKADFAKTLEPVVAKWGAPGAAAELARAWWCSIETDPSLIHLIQNLRGKGILCALASNQQRYRANYMGEVLSYNVLFDRTFYSYQLGFVKPDINYFEGILAQLAFDPMEVLFIDDSDKNVAAAQQAGLRAAQFVHPRNAHSASIMLKLLEGFSLSVW